MSWGDVLYRELDIDWMIIKRKIKSHMNYLLIAQVAHEVNRAYCFGIGDTSQKSWDEAEQWQRDSAVKGVEYKANNLSATPEDQHEAWSKDKIADGWVYGEVKDAEKKTHPCLVPYSELPLEQRIKDYLFVAVVGTMLKQQEAEKGAKISVDTEVLKGIAETASVVDDGPKALTDGQIAVDVNFNALQRKDIGDIKEACAKVYDLVTLYVQENLEAKVNLVSPSDDQKKIINQSRRLEATAKTQIELASMLAVKAVTRG